MSAQTPPTSRTAEAAIHGAAEVLYRDYASQYQADHLSWRDFADLAREALTAAGAIGAYDPNHEPGLSECGCRMCNPQPAPELAAAMADPDDGYLTPIDVLEQERDQARAELDQLRKRFAYVAAALDADALATQPSKKSQIQADAARRIREALA